VARASLLIASLLLLGGCSSNDVNLSVTFDPLASFPREAEFRWELEKSTMDKRLEPLGIREILVETAQAAFAKRGYRATDGDAPYNLTYHVSVQEILEANASRSVGSFWLDLTDAKTGHRLWTGYGRAEVSVGISPKQRRSRFTSSMNKLLADFPPAQR